MTPLRRQFLNDLAVRGLSENTQRSYLQAVIGLVRYYQRSPDLLTAPEVQQYLLHLRQDRGLSWGSCNTVSYGLRFFYRITLGNAQALSLEDRIGSLEPGREADMVVLDARATPAMALKMDAVTKLTEELFLLQTLGDDRAIVETYVAGEPAKSVL